MAGAKPYDLVKAMDRQLRRHLTARSQARQFRIVKMFDCLWPDARHGLAFFRASKPATSFKRKWRQDYRAAMKRQPIDEDFQPFPSRKVTNLWEWV